MSNFKQLIAGIVIGAVVFGAIPVMATNGTKNISAVFKNIKVMLDGKEVKTSAEPFQYNGKVYVPADLIPLVSNTKFNLDTETNTVQINSKPSPETLPIKKDNITYSDLIKEISNSSYAKLRGNIVNYSGKIMSVMSYQNVTKYIVSLKNTESSVINTVEIVVKNSEIPIRFNKDDNVDFKAEVLGYTTEIVSDISFILPQLLVKTITKTNSNNATSDTTNGTKNSSPNELKEYLESMYSELETCIGTTKFTFFVDENTTTIFPWDYWIQVGYEYSFFEGAMISNKYSNEQKTTLRHQLKEFQEKLAKDIISKAPDKKLYGGYYNSYYKYPTLKLDLQTSYYYSWTNYNEVDFLVSDKYNAAKPSTFRWYSLIDDNL